MGGFNLSESEGNRRTCFRHDAYVNKDPANRKKEIKDLVKACAPSKMNADEVMVTVITTSANKRLAYVTTEPYVHPNTYLYDPARTLYNIRDQEKYENLWPNVVSSQQGHPNHNIQLNNLWDLYHSEGFARMNVKHTWGLDNWFKRDEWDDRTVVRRVRAAVRAGTRD